MHCFVCSDIPPGTTTSTSGGSCTAGADGAPYLVLCNVRQIAFLGVRSVCCWEDLYLLQRGAIGWSQKGLSKGKQHFHPF